MLNDLQSDMIMERLIEDAKAKGAYAHVRLGTLSRLEKAVSDILSGKAYWIAEEAGEVDNPFSPNRPRINYSLIGRYVRLRQRSRQSDSHEWKGPTAEFLRRDQDLKAYVDARRVEALGHRQKVRSKTAANLEEALKKLPIEDQYLVRQEIENGRVWKQELDLAKALMKKIEHIDVEELLSSNESGRIRPSAASLEGGHSDVLKRLVIRLKNNEYLAEFGLKYADGYLKMSFAPGRSLINAEEMALIASLGRVPER